MNLIEPGVATEVCCTIADALDMNERRAYIVRIYTGDEPCSVTDVESGGTAIIPPNRYIEIDMDCKSSTGRGQDRDRFSGTIYHHLPDDDVCIKTDDVESLLTQCRSPGAANVTGLDKLQFPTIHFDANGITDIDYGRLRL